MKNHLCATGLLALMTLGSTVGLAQSATTFTYQGKLLEGGQEVSRNVDLRVRLFDSPDGGTQIGPELQRSGVAASEGVFSVNLDFGAEPIATGAARWLEISVKRPGGSTMYEKVSPRTLLTSVPASMSTRGIVVDADGRVGINSAMPGAMLDVRGVADSGIYLQAGNGRGYSPMGYNGITPGSNVQIYGGSGGAGFLNGAGAGGSVEIQAGWGGSNSAGSGAVGGALYLTGGTGGTSAKGGNLVVEAGAGGKGAYLGSGGNGASLFLRGGKGGAFNIYGSNGATGAVVVDQGNFGIGTASPVNPLHVSTGAIGGDWQVRMTNTTVPNFQGGVRISDNGFLEMTNQIGGPAFARLSSNGVWTAVSDIRLKSNIHEADGMLRKALALRPITYTLKGSSAVQIGFSAQQVDEVVPELVEHGSILTMDYSRMSVIAIGAIQEQERELVRAKSAMEAMRAKNAELEARLEKMEQLLKAR